MRKACAAAAEILAAIAALATEIRALPVIGGDDQSPR